jgi:tetratricopeptide (TPR) repeat protein
MAGGSVPKKEIHRRLIMPSEKSTQSFPHQQTSDHNVEIITPLKVRSHTGQPDTPRFFRFTVMPIYLVLIALVVMAAGGFIFIRHLSKHPVKVNDKIHGIETSEVNLQQKQVPDTTRSSGVEIDPLTPSAAAGLDPQQATEPQQAIPPEKRGLEKEKAEKPDAANHLIESGKTHEKHDRIAFALTDYQEALRLNPESEEAQKALNRVKERIAGQQFQKLISDGLAEYHDGRYQSARTRLLKAKSFRPDSPEVQSALSQVDEAIRIAEIEKLRHNAMTAEQTEDWDKALRAYLAVLDIDPNISFAAQGKERALEHLRIAKRIRFFLEKPDVLESNSQLQNAVLLIEEAESLQPKGPRLNQRLDDLKALVDAARSPVQVMIKSDNLTEVAVYKVGKFGRFTTREVSLRPGSYTVVGSRDGYKDVRQKIIVKPRQKALHVTVICKNKV